MRFCCDCVSTRAVVRATKASDAKTTGWGGGGGYRASKKSVLNLPGVVYGGGRR